MKDQERHVSISKGNSKMGGVPSVSLPPIITCRRCTCHAKCYANKIARIRPNVAQSYQNNLDILTEDPDKYWREVEAAIMTSRYFRFHVAGDIPDAMYFQKMVAIAQRNPHCSILCFTKKYEIVNEYLADNWVIPGNLRMVLSGWQGLTMNNPYDLPEAHVRYRDGTTTARPNAKHCGGNCTECFLTDCGCWTLIRGEQVIFDEH